LGQKPMPMIPPVPATATTSRINGSLSSDPELAQESTALVKTAGVLSYVATVSGSGAIAQGPSAMAAGEGGIAVGGKLGATASTGRN
jgi:hypothetical protein